ncbi:hypothetical protein [Ktedonospora formicarum]|uniref:Uncharacterized protein n=1 Tax=Ktedonospora formicarum TaxID=2778364 RepID=A0A8J3HW30_9CHLR|nr:hypothetical protein [Ktedonospora formicarum]GHO45152.1 hypothetical protein KSX_33150 [Ktedonospora formicarum]
MSDEEINAFIDDLKQLQAEILDDLKRIQLDNMKRMLAEMLLEQTLEEVAEGLQPLDLDQYLAVFLYEQLAKKGVAHCRLN